MLDVFFFWIGCLGFGLFYLRDFKHCLWEKGIEITVLLILLESLKGILIIWAGQFLFETAALAESGIFFTLLGYRLASVNDRDFPGTICLIGMLAATHPQALQLAIACWLSFILMTKKYGLSKQFTLCILPLCLIITKAPFSQTIYFLLGVLLLLLPSRLQFKIYLQNVS